MSDFDFGPKSTSRNFFTPLFFKSLYIYLTLVKAAFSDVSML